MIPSGLAIFRLTIRSILVGSWTGRSEGLAPLRILVDVTGALAENGFDVRHVTQETACIAKKHARQTVLARQIVPDVFVARDEEGRVDLQAPRQPLADACPPRCATRGRRRS